MSIGMFLRSAVMSLAVLIASQGVKADDEVSAVDAKRAEYFYVGLDYSPAFSKIRDFSIKDSNEKSRALYPYLDNGDVIKLESNRFDWHALNPRIRFQDNMLIAMEGSVGYGVGNARVEIEVGYERFKIRGTGSRLNREDSEADAIYLLAKELAYDIATMQPDRLASALAEVSGKDIANFAKTIEVLYPGIDKKVCVTKKSEREGYGEYYYITQTEESGNTVHNNHVSLCGGRGGNGEGGNDPQHLQHFVRWALEDGIRNWPTSTSENWTVVTYQPLPNDNAEAVAKDLINELTSEEKVIVSGLLAKTIEGVGVVEIRSLSSTSVTVNVCSDISVSNAVVPYICVGPGLSFIGVVDGHTIAKFAYRLKAGLSYKLSKEVTAFTGGFYHHVVGDGVYEDLPLRHLADDISLAEHAKDTAIASFDMSYVGGEFGVRLAF
ncbi:P44/Msp2 family outer membrane protein [Anaplasma phagocytophilum]|uniref:P44/Msp2 family outer membrane protein n=1 Tax=Anaplasma phagocytophilum TaxID=948 RepID=UPI000A98E530|nr:P44/Msp2 family outer membrane protein [Anaplasma phagocytophilum]